MRNKAREPEEHGDGLNGQDRVRVRGTREKPGSECEEWDDQERGPDAIEDEEVDAIGGGVKGVAVPP